MLASTAHRSVLTLLVLAGIALPPSARAGTPGSIEAIAAGDDHTCGIVDGTVWCWGGNYEGQLGDGTMTSRSTPAKYDPQLNLYELDGRFYDPVIGRYLSRDARLSYLACWPGTCVTAATPLTQAGLPAPDVSLGGYCGAGLDMKVMPEGYVTFHGRGVCSGPGEGRQAHIVIDDMRICKMTCATQEGLPAGQCCLVYTFGGGDALEVHGHDPVSMVESAAHPAHALLLHDFSCDACFKRWAPTEDTPWGIPCGTTERTTVPGLPGGWTDTVDAKYKKDCGGADWVGQSEVHFFAPYGTKKPWDNGDQIRAWTYQYETGPEQGENCGGHEYDAVEAFRIPSPYGGTANVEGARNLATYHTGQGIWCYQTEGSARS
jgi:hypothetical protein